MLDTINKMRALVNMKTTLIEALRSDLDTAVNRIMRLEARVEELEKEQTWYQQQDEEQERQGQSVDVPVTTKECSSLDLIEDPDAMWRKGTHR